MVLSLFPDYFTYILILFVLICEVVFEQKFPRADTYMCFAQFPLVMNRISLFLRIVFLVWTKVGT